MQSPFPIEIHVHPQQGNDAGAGDAASPFKTVHRALQQATAGMTIRLARGTYSLDSGEQFPIVVPPGLTLVGNLVGQGSGVVIVGSGDYSSLDFGSQQVTLVLQDEVQLRGVTVTNPMPRGTGIWIESTEPTIAGCTLLCCQREGVLVTGLANPVITNTLFQDNRASGLTLVRSAKGEIRQNLFRGNGLGLAIGDQAGPLVAGNQLLENRCGILISGQARPVLRSNAMERNRDEGLLVLGQAQPDLGNLLEKGGNRWQHNGTFDLRNATEIPIVSVGNALSPARLNGLVELCPLRIPAVPAPPVLPSAPQKSSGSRSSQLPPDVQGHWAAEFVQAWQTQQPLDLEAGLFHPDAPVSEAAFSAWLSVLTRAAADTAVAPALASDRPLTRLRALQMLVEALHLPGGEPSGLQVYRDRVQIPSSAAATVAAATQCRLVVRPYPQWLAPLGLLSRAEAVAMLYQALVYQGQAAAVVSPYLVRPRFDQVAFADTASHWAAPLIHAAATYGVMAGNAEGHFQPDQPLSGRDYAAILGRTLQHNIADQVDLDQPVPRSVVLQTLAEALQLPPGDPDLLSRYTDAHTVPPSAATALAAATQRGLVVNYPQLNQLQPMRAATRGEIAAMVYQALAYLGRVPALDSPYRVDPTRSDQPLAADRPVIVVLDPGHGGADGGVVTQTTPSQSPSPERAAVPQEAPLLPSTSMPLRLPPGVLPGFPTINQPAGRLPGAMNLTPDGTIDGAPETLRSLPSLQEKSITLSVAREVAGFLRKQGIEVVLTRPGDHEVDLTKRAEMAKTVAATVLVSLHVNADWQERRYINGIETYHYPGASESAKLAWAIHKSLTQLPDVQDRGVRTAHFYLLRSLAIPAVHLEIGFITGEADALSLANPAYHRYLARAITNGILRYVGQATR
ncbi:MAG: DUF1565 domain-containing protein [Synechococcales cyanobacterium M58_A2018_015]|nr:DUF1565 domain-containing protein [Synechococcales cyanobacterium M58_A2018_015]